MIDVRFAGRGSDIYKFSVKGHAGYDESGKDLVCAAVSSIVIGTMNAIDILEKDSCDFQIRSENHITIRVIHNNMNLQTILNVMKIQLQSIEEQYSEFIRIEFTEG